MKTILVPTDFSEISKNAIEYACEIAKLMPAKIILFHAYHVPVAVTTEVLVVMPSLEEIEKAYMESLEKVQKNIYLNYGSQLQTECACKCGFAVEEINLFAKENNIDLIVMGMQGVGYLSERIIGSNTTLLLRNSQCPVLAIDKDVRFKTIKKIVLACDYVKMENKTTFKFLKEIVNLFKSHVYVLKVVNEFEAIPRASESVNNFVTLEDSLSDVEHSLHYLKDKNVVDGIKAFISERNMDMVVMIPHKHSILKNIFNEPNTKRMAFHTTIPLLAIQE